MDVIDDEVGEFNDEVPIEESDEIEGEPGGDSGEAVYARKLHREKTRALELLDEKERELEALRAAPKTPFVPQNVSEDVVPTETEIHQMYSDNKIDATEAERLLAKAEEKKQRDLEDRIVRRVNEENKGQEILTGMKSDLDSYIKAIPALTDQTSDEFAEVKAEYNKLVSMGSPANTVTELLAVKSTFGTLDRVKGLNNQNLDQYDRDNRDTDMSRSGGSRASDNRGSGGNAPDKGILKRVSADQKEYWTSQGFSLERQAKLAEQIHPDKLSR